MFISFVQCALHSVVHYNSNFVKIERQNASNFWSSIVNKRNETKSHQQILVMIQNFFHFAKWSLFSLKLGNIFLYSEDSCSNAYHEILLSCLLSYRDKNS